MRSSTSSCASSIVIRRSALGISRISALVKVVLPEPVGPETKIFLRRLTTASRMNASYSGCEGASRAPLRSHRAPRSRGASCERSPLCELPDRPDLIRGPADVIATDPGVVAGGSTIWTRSPLGRDADKRATIRIDPLAGRVRDELREPLSTTENPQMPGQALPPCGSRQMPPPVD